MWSLPDRWRVFDRPLGSVWNDPEHSLLPWNPFAVQETESVTRSGWGRTMFDDRVPFIPLCDFVALNAGYILSIDMPGVERKDIELEIEGDHLFLRGDRKGQHPRSYQRMITLPGDIRNDQIEAHYVNGVLHVAFPKASATMHHHIKMNEGRADSSGRFLRGRARERQRTLDVRAAESQQH